MVNEIFKSDCKDSKDRYQSRGDVAIYYLEIQVIHKKIIKITKFNADCIKAKLAIAGKICDSFFYLKKGGKSQLKEKWILVETKGKNYGEAIIQLDNSLNLFMDAISSVSGRIVAKNIPNILPSSDRNDYEKLYQRFILKGGNLARGNKIMREKIDIQASEIISDYS